MLKLARKISCEEPRGFKRAVMFALFLTVSLAVVAVSASLTRNAPALMVTNLNDSGPGSLRQAILDANASPGEDTIVVAPDLSGTITLTSGQLTISDDLILTGPGEGLLAVSGNNTSRVFEIVLAVNVTMSDLTIRDGVVSGINGGGILTRGRLNLQRCTLSNNSAFQGGAIFNESLVLTATNVSISGNSASQSGGGIFNDTGSTKLINSVVRANNAPGGGGFANGFALAEITNSTVAENTAIFNGGGILNDGSQLMVTGAIISGNTVTGTFGRGGGIDNHLASTLTITESTISDNSARDGGGIDSSSSCALTITGSTISNNRGGQGGGIMSSDHSTLTVTNSTISGNSATPFQGGGIRNSGDAANISNCTISGNSAPVNQFGSAGGLYNATGPLTVKNSIVASNVNGDCFSSSAGSITGLGVNFSTDGSCPGFTQATPAQLNLGPLENNGGATQTHALLPGSVAVDSVTDCTDITNTPVEKDQRGIERPVDGDGDGEFRCDAGAYEAPAQPTAIRLESIVAAAYDNGVLLEWQTGFEVQNLGFHLYREQNGQRSRITPEIVAGSALIAGNTIALTAGKAYAWWDALSKDNRDVRYWLEDIDLDGRTALHGPVAPKRIAGLPAQPSIAALLTRIGKGEPYISQLAANQTGTPLHLHKKFEQPGDLAAKQAIKITIREEGWYRVAQPELLAAGLDPRTDPRNLQLYLEGEEQAMLVAGEQDGSLNHDDAIEFYAYGQDTPSSDAHTLWLVSGKQPGKRIINLKSDATPDVAAGFSYTLERKERTIYFSGLKNGDNENFFGRVIASQPVDQELKLQHLDRASQADGVLEVALQGVTDLPGTGPDHQVKVTLNGTEVGRISFDGRQHTVQSFSAPYGLLKEGENIVSLAAEAGLSDISLVDFIRITYQHSYTADQDALRMTVGGDGEMAPPPQTILGFTNSSIRVIDVTSPSEPQELKGRVEEHKDGGFAVTVQAAGGGPRTLIALTANRIKRPASITANRPSTWWDKNHRADLLIITDRIFERSLSPLIALRQKRGLACETVDIEDIYDEFSFGEKSPRAIRDFLAYTCVNWKLAPRFVLFTGDASFDPRNYLGVGDFDLVPTRLIDTTYLETASDDWFADFDDDGLAEMYVGRLPVRTPTQADAVVSKIVTYESAIGRSVAPRSVLLVADRNDGFNFEQASGQLRSLVPANTTVGEIFRGRLDDETAKKQLIGSIKSGQAIVNYTGHGSANSWRGLFATGDIRLLQNKTLPIFIAMTCLNGFIQDPLSESLSKGLMNAERNGAVAVWTSSGMTVPAEQALINQQLYRLLFGSEGNRGRELTIGEAAARAKSATRDLDVRRTWLLLGDPTMRLGWR